MLVKKNTFDKSQGGNDMKKKMLALLFGVMMSSVAITGCSKKKAEGFDSKKEITVVSREDGSGTRSAFIELFGIEVKNDAGEKIDQTTQEANITNSTSVMMTTVANDEYAIGYISLGSLNDTVKALEIDGAKATQENVKTGSYRVARPFNIATKDQLSDVAKDFIQYILSTQGQAIVSENGYVSMDDSSDFVSNQATGKIVVAGSSSVSPLMEKLKEGYLKVVNNVEIEIQTSDSTTGASAAAEGIADIGMCSRELKDSEIEKGLFETAIAMDGIAVIVNNNNPNQDMTTQEIYDIYTGASHTWDDLK